MNFVKNKRRDNKKEGKKDMHSLFLLLLLMLLKKLYIYIYIYIYYFIFFFQSSIKMISLISITNIIIL